MVCPQCGTVIDENCEVCYNCQMEFKHAEAEKKPDKPDRKPKKDKKDKKDKKSLINKIKSAEKPKHFKIIAIAFASIVYSSFLSQNVIIFFYYSFRRLCVL